MRNKEHVSDSRFPILRSLLIYASSAFTYQYSLPQANNFNSLISLHALHADEIDKTQTSINPNIVKKNKELKPGIDSLFPICTLKTSVIHTTMTSNDLVPGLRFPIPCFRFTVSKYPRRLFK